MDMFIAAMAERGSALLIDCRRSEGQAIVLPPPSEATILVVDTAVRHELASSAYAQRRTTCEQAARRLGVPALRDATTTMLESASLTEPEHKRALHVVNENTRTLAAAEALKAGDVVAFGRLMFESHDSLRYLFEVSCEELNTVVDAARTLHEANSGVLGARMTGGGFGGCAIILCRSASATAVSKALRQAFLSRHGREPGILTTSAAGPAEPLSPPAQG
jgi:galactokinase